MTNVLTGLTDGDILTRGALGAQMSADADSDDATDTESDADGTDAGSDTDGTDSDSDGTDSDSDDATDVDGTDG